MTASAHATASPAATDPDPRGATGDPAPPDGPETQAPLELLAFRVGEDEYSVEITAVREIRSWSAATPLPHTPDYMCGVINLRGTILPILDLSRRLGLGPRAGGARDVIVVLQLAGRSIGLHVAAVSDILSLPASALEPPPAMGDCSGERFVSALALLGERMVRVLDLDTILPPIGQDAA